MKIKTAHCSKDGMDAMKKGEADFSIFTYWVSGTPSTYVYCRTEDAKKLFEKFSWVKINNLSGDLSGFVSVRFGKNEPEEVETFIKSVFGMSESSIKVMI